MSWTKADLVNSAYGELSLADAAGIDVTPEERTRAVKRLNAMMGTWAAKGVRIGFNFPGGLNDDSGISDMNAETVFLNLAKRLAPALGKALSPETLKNARDGYDTLLWAAAMPPEQQLPHTQPRGAGNKPWRITNARTFMPHPDTSPLQYDDDSGDLDILQE
jgi:hypothetical protein